MIFFCPSDNVYYNIVRVLTTEGKCQHVFPVRLNQRESEFAQNIGKCLKYRETYFFLEVYFWCM